MGTNECSQPASKSSWDSQDFGDISMVLKIAHFRKSTGPRWVKSLKTAEQAYDDQYCIPDKQAWANLRQWWTRVMRDYGQLLSGIMLGKGSFNERRPCM